MDKNRRRFMALERPDAKAFFLRTEPVAGKTILTTEQGQDHAPFLLRILEIPGVFEVARIVIEQALARRHGGPAK